MNFADPVIMLRMGLDKASVQASEDQLVQSIRSAITKAEPQFEKIEAFLRTAFSKANPGAVLEASLSKALRGAAGGRFGDSYIAEFQRIESAARSAGNAFLAASANAGRQLNLSAAGRLDVHPSWESSRIESIQQMGYNAWRHAHIEEQAMATGSLASFQAGTSFHPDTMMQRLSTWQQNETVVENKRLDALYGDQKAGRIWRHAHEDEQRIDNQAHNAVQQHMIDRYNASNPAPSLTYTGHSALGIPLPGMHTGFRSNNPDPQTIAFLSDRQMRSNDLRMNERLKGITDDAHFVQTRQQRLDSMSPEARSRYESMPTFMQDRIDARQDKAASGRRWSSMHGHNFRFASQNVGFGIDDAIQSYHYGGIGASIRAASNNVTAIAGMTIANPAIAAATVVGLSVATAALPLVLRKMGYDENRIKAEATGASDASNVRLSQTGQISGNLRRGESVTAAYSSKVEEYYKATDQELANNSIRERAKSVIDLDANGRPTEAHFSIHDENAMIFQRAQAEGRGRAAYVGDNESERAAAGRREAVAFDEHLKWLKNDDATGGARFEKIAVLKEQMEYIKSEAKTSFRHNEAQVVRDFGLSGSLYQASTPEAYVSALKAKHTADSVALAATELKPHELLRKQTELDLRLQEDLSKKSEINRTVQSNVRERNAFERNELTAYLSDPLQSSLARQNVKADLYNKMMENKTLSESDGFRLFSEFQRIDEQQYKKDTRDYKANAFGGADSLAQLRNSRDDRAESLSEGLKANPLSFKAYGRRMDENEQGYKYQRETLMTSMTNQYKVTSSVGQIADHYAAEARKMEKLFADNPDMTKSEQDTLRTNLEKSFIMAKREAMAPSGTERFTSDAIAVGGMHDRELQARMLGTFVSSSENDYKEQSLKDFQEMLKVLGRIEESLEAVRSGL